MRTARRPSAMPSATTLWTLLLLSCGKGGSGKERKGVVAGGGRNAEDVIARAAASKSRGGEPGAAPRKTVSPSLRKSAEEGRRSGWDCAALFPAAVVLASKRCFSTMGQFA